MDEYDFGAKNEWMLTPSVLLTSVITLVLILVGVFPGWVLAVETKAGPVPGSYPSVYYRGPEFKGIHCVPAYAPRLAPELYLLNTTLPALGDGKHMEVEVAEFFSGRRYRASLVVNRDYLVSLMAHDTSVELDCISKASLGILDKTQPIDAAGDYLNLERIGTSGQFGDVDLDNKCDAGNLGWFECDVGTFGLSRRAADGKILWARFIAVGVRAKGGHPIYKLPQALRITDRFDHATLLEDGTAVLTFNGAMSVRIDVNNGELLEQRQGVADVPLNNWAELKRIMNERWHGVSRPCKSSDMKCEQRLIEMYFYTLQNYLFPLNQIQEPNTSGGVQHGKPE